MWNCLQKKHLYYKVYSIPPPIREKFIECFKKEGLQGGLLRHDTLLNICLGKPRYIKNKNEYEFIYEKISIKNLVPYGLSGYYEKYLEFIEKAIKKTWGKRGFKVRFEVEKLVTGIGEKGPLEMGLTVHPIFGLPYIPGSTMKGVFRTFFNVIRLLDPKLGISEGLIQTMFGTQSKSGILIFTDALPALEGGFLYFDVINPHHKIDPKSDVITLDETKNPEPLAILALKDTTFTMYILINTTLENAQEYENILRNIESKLNDENSKVLFTIGARTGSGYGRIKQIKFEAL